MSGKQHLDAAAVAELKGVMGSDFALLAQTFFTDSGQRIEAVRAALDASDAEALRRAAHSFKGSSSNMGAPHLAELCRALEELGRGGSVQGGRQLLDELAAEFDAVRVELGAMLD